MDYKMIRFASDGGVATIVLNRPEVYNALNEDLAEELSHALHIVADDESVRVVVLTGEGKAFCSGQDLKSVDISQKIDFGKILTERYNPIVKIMRSMPKPVICRLNGIAAGAGSSLALACDMIIAAESAALAEVFVNIGLVLDSGASYFLPKLVGSAKAFELATTGRKIDAKEAGALGLVNHVVADDELDAAVAKFTTYYASAPTMAIGLIKGLLNDAGSGSLEEMLNKEAQAQDIAGESYDFKEGVKAFIEKRKPIFKGK